METMEKKQGRNVISDETMEYVGILAKLELSQEERERARKDMEEMLYQGITPEERMLLRRLILEMRENLLNSKDFKGMDFKDIIEKTTEGKGEI